MFIGLIRSKVFNLQKDSLGSNNRPTTSLEISLRTSSQTRYNQNITPLGAKSSTARPRPASKQVHRKLSKSIIFNFRGTPKNGEFVFNASIASQ